MENKLNLDEIEKLPAKERALLKKRHALHCKYEKAVTLYADTTLSTRIIALRCGVTPGALGNYLRRYCTYSGAYPFTFRQLIRV